MTYYSDKTKPSTDLARGAPIQTYPHGPRTVRCPICGESFRVARGNALGQTNKLRGILGRHIREKHPQIDRGYSAPHLNQPPE